MNPKSSILLGLVALGCLVSAPASSTTINLTASADCAQANAGAGTCGSGGSGTGSATITLDDVTNLLSWNVSWAGLSGPALAAHFHGPALPNQNAGVQVPIGVPSPRISSTIITASQTADLLAGLWYLNIPTNAFPGGEIRGLVIPEPSTALLLAVGLATGLFGLGLRPVFGPRRVSGSRLKDR